MIVIDQEVLATKFMLPNPNIIIHLPQDQVPFYFKGYDSDTLVVTFGDSWTWGSDISNAYSSEYRCNNVYGHQLAREFSADFLNLAVPGAGNQYIHQLFCDFAKIVKDLTYKRIIAIIVFTEIGRDFNGWFDRSVDYRQWLDANIISSDSYTDLLKWMNSRLTQSIADQIVDLNSVELYVGSNFVDPLGLEPLDNHRIPKTWVEVCSGLQNHVAYAISPYIYDKLESVRDLHWGLDRLTYLEWAAEQLKQAGKRAWTLRDKKLYINNHPSLSSHTVWAEYVKSFITSRYIYDYAY